jgi:hypothetical protein
MKVSDEYKLFFDHVNGLMERRTSVTTTYLSVNAAIIAALAFLFKDGQLSSLQEKTSALLLIFAGFVASILWSVLIRQHSILVGWWYEQLRGLESAMPESTKLITEEYNNLYFDTRGKAKVGLTQYELGLALLFAVTYVLFSLGILMGPSLGLG